MNDKLTIYCLPVSGGSFCSQLGLLAEIYAAKKLAKNGKFNGSQDYQPNICLCSSGGNVSAYIGMAADWSDTGIERISRKIRSEIFVKSWVPSELSFLPSWLFSFKGAIFRQGCGGYGIFNAMFTEKTIKRVEIWTGTYDVKNNKAQFFCNLKKSESLVNPNFFEKDEYLNCSMPLKYLNNDLNSISEVSVASASIPMLVTEQNFSGLGYLDGGIMYPSPLKVLSNEICRLILDTSKKRNNVDYYEIDNDCVKKISAFKKNTKKLRLTYFISYQPDLENTQNCTSCNNLSIIHNTVKQLLHTNTLQDRNSAIDILKRLCINEEDDIENITYYNLTTLKLANIFKEIENYRHYVLIIFPKGTFEVKLVNIKTEDLINKIRLSRIDYGVDLWYLK